VQARLAWQQPHRYEMPACQRSQALAS